jgi:hypothetical protein
MKTKIEIFIALDDIAKKYRITDDDWAKQSDIRRPSISELRRLVKINFAKSSEKIGRSCTLDKITSLFKGLHKILGGDVLRNELTEAIKKEKDAASRLILWSMILKDAPLDTIESVESHMRIAAQTINTKKK